MSYDIIVLTLQKACFDIGAETRKGLPKTLGQWFIGSTFFWLPMLWVKMSPGYSLSISKYMNIDVVFSSDHKATLLLSCLIQLYSNKGLSNRKSLGTQYIQQGVWLTPLPLPSSHNIFKELKRRVLSRFKQQYLYSCKLRMSSALFCYNSRHPTQLEWFPISPQTLPKLT